MIELLFLLIIIILLFVFMNMAITSRQLTAIQEDLKILKGENIGNAIHDLPKDEQADIMLLIDDVIGNEVGA